MAQRRVCKTRYQGFDSPLGLVDVLKILIAGLLFLGALRTIKIGSELVLRAYEARCWAVMYQLDSYPSKRLYLYAGCSLIGTLILAGAAGAIGFTIFT